MVIFVQRTLVRPISLVSRAYHAQPTQTQKTTTTTFNTGTLYTTTFNTSTATGESRSTATSRTTTSFYNTTRSTTESRNTSTVFNTTTAFNTTKTTATEFNTTGSTSTTTVYATALSLSNLERSSATSFNFACFEFPSITFYFTNASAGIPTTNSVAYTNSSGTSTLSDGYYAINDGTAIGATHFIRVSGGSGNIIQVTSCGGGGGFPSDRRLKKNINFLYQTHDGINIYTFEYKSHRGKYEGVIADEVENIEGAVYEVNGYKHVNYDKINVEFKQLK